MNATKTAGIYVRVSTREQAREGTSLSTQEERCEAYVTARGWRVHRIYRDEGESGAKDRRPALDALMADCRANRIDHVVVAKLDRFSRNSAHLAAACQELDGMGVALVSVSESFDSASATGRLMRGILGQFAEHERERINERTCEGLEARAREGGWAGGPAPFGYRIIRDGGMSVLEPDPDEVKVLHTAVDLVIDSGCSTWETAGRLNALGLTPRRAPLWRHQNLRRTLRSESMVGRHTWFRASTTGREPVEMQFTPLMTEARWAALQSVLDAVAVTDKAKPRIYPLTGRLTGGCGAPYYGIYRKDRDKRTYRCFQSQQVSTERCDDRWRPPADEIEDAVWEEVVSLVASPDNLRAMACQHLEVADASDANGRLQEANKHVTSLEEGLKVTIVGLAKAGLDAASVAEAAAELNAQLLAARQERDQLAYVAEQSDAARSVAGLSAQALINLKAMGLSDRKRIFSLLDVRVRIIQEGSRYEPGRFLLTGTVPSELLRDDSQLFDASDSDRGHARSATGRRPAGGWPFSQEIGG